MGSVGSAVTSKLKGAFAGSLAPEDRAEGWEPAMAAARVAMAAVRAAQTSSKDASVAGEIACHKCARFFNSRRFRQRCRRCRHAFCDTCSDKRSLLPISAERATRYGGAASTDPVHHPVALGVASPCEPLTLTRWPTLPCRW